MKETYKPYIVSADVKNLIKRFALEKKLEIPNEAFFKNMLSSLEIKLKEYFKDVEIIPEKALSVGLNEMISSSPIPVISLDRAYARPQQNLLAFLDVNRTVNANLENTGLKSRAAEISLEEQLNKIAKLAKGQVIVLLDDVVFEGKTMLDIAQRLFSKGVVVDRVFSGVTIEEGKKLLESAGIEVESVIPPFEDVIDEICERDFIAGTPQSGRTVISQEGKTTGAPYIYPFGKPVEWASIPEDNSMEFSIFCLRLAINMWTEIEEKSGRKIYASEVSKPINGISGDEFLTEGLLKSITKLNS